MDTKKFVISRFNWLRGEGGFHSRLYRPNDGKMCCLGQIGLQCGLTKEDISDKDTPDGLVGGVEKYPSSLIHQSRYSTKSNTKGINSTALADAMMEVNDNRLSNDAQKEKELKELALKGGFELEFTD